MKIASRFLLPLELVVAVLMLSWGISGWFGGGLLWVKLAEHGLTREWGLSLCAVGLVQLAVAGFEWCFGRYWERRVLLRCVRLRLWVAFCAIVVWFYACFLMLTIPTAADIFALMMQAPAALLACVAIVIENTRVAAVLDPDVPTQGLQAKLERERRRGWSAEEDMPQQHLR